MESEIFKDFLLKARYEQAMKTLEGFGEIEQRDILLNTGYETESISIIGFLDYLKTQNWPKQKIYKWLVELMLNPLCFIEGAYGLGVYYARNLVEIEPSVENLELLLFFNEIPEKLVGDDEAKLIALEILKIDSGHSKAKEIIQREK